MLDQRTPVAEEALTMGRNCDCDWAAGESKSYCPECAAYSRMYQLDHQPRRSKKEGEELVRLERRFGSDTQGRR